MTDDHRALDALASAPSKPWQYRTPVGDPVSMPVPATGRVLIFGREPAVLAEFVAALLVVANLYFLPGLDNVLQGAINAVILAAAAVYVAIKVKSDSLLPLLVGGFKVVIALIVTAGVDLTVPQQAAALTLLTLAAGLFVRSQVTAPVTVDGEVLYSRPTA